MQEFSPTLLVADNRGAGDGYKVHRWAKVEPPLPGRGSWVINKAEI